MKKPVVSIIMSTYTDASYINDAIESVLQQTFLDWEFIIIDDTSTDNTGQIIDEITRKDDRFVVIHNKRNKGQTLNLVLGVELAKGEFIARIDGDDIWIDKSKLQKQINFLKDNPEYGLIGCWANIVDKNGYKTSEGRSPCTDNAIRSYMLIENCFFHSSVMIRRSIVEKVGNYDSRVRSSQDYEYWLRIGLVYKMHNLDKFMINYRMNPNGMTSTNYDLQLSDTFEMVKKFKNFYPHYRKAIFLWRLRKYVPKVVKTAISNQLKNKFISRKAKELFINFEMSGA
jgi:glycosyltransferase EpsE